MRYLVIAKSGFKDIGTGEAPYIDNAFDQAIKGVMHYAITEKIITNSNDLDQRNAAMQKLKPHFEFRYICT